MKKQYDEDNVTALLLAMLVAITIAGLIAFMLNDGASFSESVVNGLRYLSEFNAPIQ